MKKKKGVKDEVQLTSKQKEMIQVQLEKEAAVRKRLLEVRKRAGGVKQEVMSHWLVGRSSCTDLCCCHCGGGSSAGRGAAQRGVSPGSHVERAAAAGEPGAARRPPGPNAPPALAAGRPSSPAGLPARRPLPHAKTPAASG